MHEVNVIINNWPEWKVVEKLGAGSFGAVYKCCKTEHGVDVYSAVKVIHVSPEDTGLAVDTASQDDIQTVVSDLRYIVDSCMDEIRILASVKGNNNIVSIEDFKCVENESGFGWTILIRMELLNSFTAYMNKHSFTEKEVLQFGIDICSALQVCEAKDIVHRDIKPANILMTEMGTFKLGDFGIARKLEGSKDGLSSKGTRSYMAPEVFSTGRYSSDVDTYSLGIVMYQLLNKNRLPFQDPYAETISYTDRNNAVSARMNGKSLPDPCDASSELAAVLRKACAFDPAKRYSSASHLQEDLKEILHAWKNGRQNQIVLHALQDDEKTETDPDATVLCGTTAQTEVPANRFAGLFGNKKRIAAVLLSILFVCGLTYALWGHSRLPLSGSSTVLTEADEENTSSAAIEATSSADIATAAATTENIRLKTITVVVMDAETRKFVSNAEVSVSYNEDDAAVLTQGFTDENGEIILGIPVRDIRISVQSYGYKAKTSLFNAANSKLTKVDMYITPEEKPVDEEYNRRYADAIIAYDAFCNAVINDETTSYNAAWGDVNGDKIPEVILHDTKKGNRIVYTYSESRNEVIELLNVKGPSSMQSYDVSNMTYYSISKNHVIITTGETDGVLHTVYEFSGNLCRVVKTFEKRHSDSADSVSTEYYVDDKMVANANYTEQLTEYLADYEEVYVALFRLALSITDEKNKVVAE